MTSTGALDLGGKESGSQVLEARYLVLEARGLDVMGRDSLGLEGGGEQYGLSPGTFLCWEVGEMR